MPPFAPKTYTDGTRTEVVQSALEEANLLWRGWWLQGTWTPPPDRLDLDVADLIEDSGSETAIKLRSSLGPSFVARASGANPNDTTDNLAYLQGLLDQGGTVILPPTTGRYAVAGTLTLSVPGTQVIATGAPLRQLTRGMTLFDVVAPDCTLDGIDAIGATGSPDVSGMGGSWQGSILASRWTVVNIYDTAHRLRIPWIRGRGMSSVVRVAAWTKATDAAATTYVDDIEIGTILCDAVEFGIAAKGTRRIKIGSVRGTYGNVTNAPRSPHLVYFAEGGPGHSQVTIGDCAATAGLGSTAYQLKGITGGQVARLHAEGCAGVLSLMDSVDLDITDVTSRGDTYTGSSGSVSLDQTTTLNRIRLRRTRIHMTTDQTAIQVAAGTNITLDDVYVQANHTTTGTTTQYDVDVRGSNNTIERVEVDNVGTAAWRAVGIFSGTGHVVRGIKATNVRAGIDTRATNARVHYDRRDITLHGTDGYAALTSTGAGAYGCKFVSPQTAALVAPSNLVVADSFEVPTGSNKNIGNTITGHRWELLSGSWRIDTTLRAYEANGTATQAAVVDSGAFDVSVEAGILFQSGEGLILRALDNANYITARLSTSTLTLTRFDAGTGTTLVTQAITTQVGRRYAMMVRAFGDKIEVLIDGVVVTTHTLVSADQTKFGAATKHGLRSSGSAAARFDSFRVLALA